MVQDDGRLLAIYVRRVKGCDISAFPLVGAAVDQTMHIVALFGLALLAVVVLRKFFDPIYTAPAPELKVPM